MKKLVITFLLMTFAAACVYAFPLLNQQEKVHYHAGFLVYINGVKQDFSDPKFMNYNVCSEHEKKKTADEEQIEKAHLHDSIGDVVHVHRTGGTWGDLFKNIKFELSAGPVKGYKDGREIKDILNKTIVPNESVIIIVGNGSAIDQSEKVTLEHIQQIEAKSELCGT